MAMPDNNTKRVGSKVEGSASRYDIHAKRIDAVRSLFPDLTKKQQTRRAKNFGELFKKGGNCTMWCYD